MKLARPAACVAFALFTGSASAQCLDWSPAFGPPSGGQGMNARVYDLAVHNGITPSLPP